MKQDYETVLMEQDWENYQNFSQNNYWVFTTLLYTTEKLSRNKIEELTEAFMEQD
jgi:hypothetical protein